MKATIDFDLAIITNWHTVRFIIIEETCESVAVGFCVYSCALSPRLCKTDEAVCGWETPLTKMASLPFQGSGQHDLEVTDEHFILWKNAQRMSCACRGNGFPTVSKPETCLE